MTARRKPLSHSRALVLDTLYFAQFVPTFPVEQTFDLSDVARLRKTASVRISWTVLFLKAFALAAKTRPELRQAFVPWPWSHVCEYEQSVAAVAIQRQQAGEPRLCWGRLPAPESTPLLELQQMLDRYQQEPVEQIFRRQVRFSRFPGWLRRMAWRIGLYLDVAKRGKRFGTFSVSSLAGQGTLNRFHPSIHTASLTYGPLDDEGRCLVTLICDHRILDGVAAAEALHGLRDALLGEIAEELRDMATVRLAA
jgi:hypothetical protein